MTDPEDDDEYPVNRDEVTAIITELLAGVHRLIAAQQVPTGDQWFVDVLREQTTIAVDKVDDIILWLRVRALGETMICRRPTTPLARATGGYHAGR